MDATITNVSAERLFVPGPNLDIPAGASVIWPDIAVVDLDGNSVIREGVLAGTLTVSTADDTRDAAAAIQGTIATSGALPAYAFASLPVGYEGRVAFVTDGRKTAEGAGVGTGVPAYYSAGGWKTFPADAAVTI